MSERRFALVDFTYRGKTGRPHLYEAGHIYAPPSAVAHAATSRVTRLMFWSAGGRHGEAYYVPSKDFISLPAFAAFKNADSLGLAEFERDLVATITRIRNSERLNGCGLR